VSRDGKKLDGFVRMASTDDFKENAVGNRTECPQGIGYRNQLIIALSNKIPVHAHQEGARTITY